MRRKPQLSPVDVMRLAGEALMAGKADLRDKLCDVADAMIRRRCRSIAAAELERQVGASIWSEERVH